ncbi:MAG: flagellin FliC [Anaeromyxobacter sp.]|nr:flagellin FliC [Anaeromyxobacter sp.]MBL0276153.1 flagellin FliC [Anaeromyxobacter sp.]
MAMSIRTNVASLNAQKNLYQTQGALDSSLSRLSSGFRITKAGDDAAGLGISTKLESQIKSYGQAVRNANDGLSVIQSTEAALNEQANILTRLRELAMQSASDGIGNTERTYIQTETQGLVDELERISQVTEYNGAKLLDGTVTTLDFQVGINNSATGFDRISFSTLNATTAAGGLNVTGLSLATKASAQAALSTIDTALVNVSTQRSTLGAAGNRFQSAISSIQSFSESLSAANSRIKDVDVAEETSRMARSQILSQAGVSVLAQANQTPQLALKLLG